MKFSIEGNPDYGDLTVTLDSGESLLAESNAMSRMSPHLEVRGRLLGGLFKSLIRKLAAGQTLLVGQYRPGRR